MIKVYVSRTNALSEDYFQRALSYLSQFNIILVYYDKANDYNSIIEKNKRRNVSLHILVVENSFSPLGKGIWYEYNNEFDHIRSTLLYERKTTNDFQFYNFGLVEKAYSTFVDYCSLVFEFNCTSEIFREYITEGYVDSVIIPDAYTSRSRFIDICK